VVANRLHLKRRDSRIKDLSVLGDSRIAVGNPGFEKLFSSYVHQ
jgi:hypothetical protein